MGKNIFPLLMTSLLVARDGVTEIVFPIGNTVKFYMHKKSVNVNEAACSILRKRFKYNRMNKQNCTMFIKNQQ